MIKNIFSGLIKCKWTSSKDKTETANKGPVLGVRHLQALLLYLGKIVVYISQSHINVTLVAMTNAAKSNPKFPEYKWTEKQKSYILCSLFLGYLVTQIPGAYWIRRFGVKKNLFFITLGSGIFTGLAPFCIKSGNWQILCALRFLQGLFEACENPASSQHLANWSPPAEINQLGGFVSTGIDCGTFLAMILSGAICAGPLGWPGVFYVSALLCFLWCILWLIFGANNATVSKFIGKEERAYIEKALDNSVEFQKENLPIPWRAILTSVPFWALVVVRAAEECGNYAIQTALPAYLNGVFNVNIEDNAFYTALPFIASFGMTFLLMPIAVLITKRQVLSVTAMRKCFNSMSMWLPAAGMIWIGFLDIDQKLAVVVISTISVSFTSAVVYGSILSCIEIAPNHTEVIVSFTEFFANIALLLELLVAGMIVGDESDRTQWQTCFAVIAAIYCLGDLVYLIGGTSKEQHWNSADYLQRKTPQFQSKYTTRGFDAPAVESLNKTVELIEEKNGLVIQGRKV